jgi:hypothetical protein
MGLPLLALGGLALGGLAVPSAIDSVFEIGEDFGLDLRHRKRNLARLMRNQQEAALLMGDPMDEALRDEEMLAGVTKPFEFTAGSTFDPRLQGMQDELLMRQLVGGYEMELGKVAQNMGRETPSLGMLAAQMGYLDPV